MAAKETTNSHQTDVETIVNRWLVDYYLLRAIESFKNNQYADFCSIREVLESVMRRVLPSTDAMSMKIRVLQFLSRINEGERLDVFFDSDESKTPLEAAFVVLEHMKKEFSIPQEDFENVCALVKEMVRHLLKPSGWCIICCPVCFSSFTSLAVMVRVSDVEGCRELLEGEQERGVGQGKSQAPLE
uniref:Telomere repeat-binding factor dimerisation domain-containing protein n=1 Tax=Lates calcarifer TaxID=8187 RepID=A0A4W6FWL7_LATCA